MTARSLRRAAERKALKTARKAAQLSPTSQPIQTDAVSDAQLEANRANAQLSTGPRTDEGKAKSSLNAVKTGLTGRTVLLPADDIAAYEEHMEAYESAFAPVGIRENDLVRSIAETAWRLARIPALEAGIYAVGRLELTQIAESEGAATQPALIEVQTHLRYERQLRNVHTQEARLVRRREKELAELRELQEQRQTEQGEALEQLANLYLANPTSGSAMKTEWNGFEFSKDEIKTSAAEIRTSLRSQKLGLESLNYPNSLSPAA